MAAMGACDARTQGAPIAKAIGATEDAAACVHSAARGHRLHSGSSSTRGNDRRAAIRCAARPSCPSRA